jgi:NAD(P)-dependent dehydrogenase (short-subunit alcohol dehydrogenase family)
MSRLTNKIAVVVGSGSGIGAAIAQRFAAEGAQVYATSRAVADGVSHASSGDREGSVRAVRANAGSIADLEQVFARVRSEEGRIDVLVVNAGIAEHATLGGISEDHFDRIFGLNVRSLVFATQGAIDLMQTGGSIVLIGSIADKLGRKGHGVYASSKAAVRSFARTWANELAPKGIRVNVISPGPIATTWLKAPDEIREAVIKLIPLGRLGRPDEVAAAALFLASDDSSFTTGAELYVDGGAAQV